ncbi:AFR025Cp [Eremothecium gossypii ATCC 10895]|uniref:AFR025Cp n=1 Tax=Eremothecium gossypii (strain ATCC 10895 / CBS 109.51 / FGSC 9923 / NRRL Y-1056) TaxID=284811 RepID=Q754P7_EREGS|nr:AFR025Cp [Eremothecium gossypii ATCC 10895]AAS53396.2 AFR025Cp [Eremothecium gossypii ATCC 10895]AEY97707.1 FAFR025Cp [Eremothecium gossypii FDAG1]
MERNTVHQHVSSFDLEPNPFEQSFASTKKEVGGPGRPLLQQGPPPGHALLGLANGGASDVSQAAAVAGPQKSPMRYHLHTHKPPMIQSPPILTPGGSHRLPAMLLSPQVLQPHNAQTESLLQAPGQAHLPALSPLLPGGPHNGQTTPSFLMGLTKTGLTPNESSIRTGLTPGILNGGQHTSLPLPNGGQFTPGMSSMLSSMPLTNDTRTPGGGGAASHPHSLSTVLEVPTSTSNSVAEIPMGGSSNPVTGNISLELPPERVKNTLASNRKRSLSNDDAIHGIQNTSDGSTNSNNKKKTKKSQSAPAEDPELDERDRKRKEFLERNRLAASKFRKRKKEYIKKIETDLQFYETEYNDLTSFIDSLAGLTGSAKGMGQASSDISLLKLLKQSLMRQDIARAMALVNQIEQHMISTKYIQRNGRNPRLEEDQSQQKQVNVVNGNAATAGVGSNVSEVRTPSSTIGTQPYNSGSTTGLTNATYASMIKHDGI